MEQAIYSGLKKIRAQITPLTEGLNLEMVEEVRALTHAIDTKLLTRFSPDFPLVAAICGGGSSGKSTLFNSLLQTRRGPQRRQGRPESPGAFFDSGQEGRSAKT